MKNSITKETLNLIKQFEGLRLKAYQDSVGVWTIGWGHTKGVVYGMEITESQALAYLINDLADAAVAVKTAIKVPMTDNEYGAFISLTHNIGVNGFAKSTAARKFNKGDKDGAAKGILMWNKITVNGAKVASRGLINRREAEVRYFEMNVSDAAFPTHFYETSAGDSSESPVTAAGASLGTLLIAVGLAFSGAVVVFIDKIKDLF